MHIADAIDSDFQAFREVRGARGRKRGGGAVGIRLVGKSDTCIDDHAAGGDVHETDLHRVNGHHRGKIAPEGERVKGGDVLLEIEGRAHDGCNHSGWWRRRHCKWG